jgi:hypothetical protein
MSRSCRSFCGSDSPINRIAPSIRLVVWPLVVRTGSAVPTNAAHLGQALLQCCKPANPLAAVSVVQIGAPSAVLRAGYFSFKSCNAAGRIPHKADLVQPCLPFGRFFSPALRGNPPSKFVIPFAMEDRYATVSLASLELQKSCKASLPTIIVPVPNKSYSVQAPLAF